MLKCIRFKRKLYDYLEDSLSQADRLKVKGHLDACPGCREKAAQIKAILECASAKNIPQPDKEFWQDFKVELDKKLNDELVGHLTLKPRPVFLLRPAFAYAAVLIFFLITIGSLYKFRFPAPLQFAQNDDELIDELTEEAVTLEELGESAVLDQDEDAYLEEIDFLLEIEQA